jgi:hypothetical protein
MARLARLFRYVPLTAIVVWLAAGSSAPTHAQRPAEYQVKAAYLYGFGRFVEWPASSAAETAAEFVVCVLGDDPFGRWLDDVAAGAIIKEKPVRIRRIAQPADSGSCHTLFISISEAARLRRILDALAHRAVLTVSDMPQFAQQGGMIGFTLDAGRVRFTVNVAPVQAAGLQLNSELLRVAAAILGTRLAD